LDICTREYVNAVRKYCSKDKPYLKEIHFVDIRTDVVEAIRRQFEKALDKQRLSENDTSTSCNFTSASMYSDEYTSAGVAIEDIGTSINYGSCTLGRGRLTRKGPTSLEVDIEKNVKLQCAVGDLEKCQTDAAVMFIDISGNIHTSGKDMTERMTDEMRKAYQKEVAIKLKNKNINQGSVFTTNVGGTEIKKLYHLVLDKTLINQLNKESKDVTKKAYTKLFADLIESIDANTLTMPVYGVGEYIHETT